LPGDLEGTRGELDALVALAALHARLRERDAGRHRAVVTLHDLAQQALAFLRVAAQQAREAHEKGALGGHGIDVVRVQLERPVDLRQQAAQGEDRGELLAVEPEHLAQVAHHREVGRGARVVERDGLGGQRLATREMLLAGVTQAGVLAEVALLHGLSRQIGRALRSAGNVGKGDSCCRGQCRDGPEHRRHGLRTMLERLRDVNPSRRAAMGFPRQSERLSSHSVIVRTISARTDASSRPLRRGTRKP
jgi:hypothetical protein